MNKNSIGIIERVVIRWESSRVLNPTAVSIIPDRVVLLFEVFNIPKNRRGRKVNMKAVPIEP